MDADDGAGQELRDVDHQQPVAQADGIETLQRRGLVHAVRHRDPLQVAALHELLDRLVRVSGEVAVRSDGIELRRRGKLVQGDADAGQVAAGVEHVVDDDDCVDALGVRVGDELELPDAAYLLPEAVHHHEAHPQLVGHPPRELEASAVGRADHHPVLAEVCHVPPEEVREVLVRAELVQDGPDRREGGLGLVVQVDRQEAVGPRGLHAPQEQLGRDRFAGDQPPVLPCVVQARQDDGEPVGRLALHSVDEEHELHDRKVGL
mmetsp:Transcript_8029/g.21776  ORF Transcript_8029/g.21776 Transcript_8029/m.21776 type:complete len:262 (-) Transcript_8029:314-1099(-)